MWEKNLGALGQEDTEEKADLDGGSPWMEQVWCGVGGADTGWGRSPLVALARADPCPPAAGTSVPKHRPTGLIGGHTAPGCCGPHEPGSPAVFPLGVCSLQLGSHQPGPRP